MHRNKSLKAMLLILGILSLGLVIGCISRMEDTKIKDYGKLQIGENLYLKKFVLNSGDRVYMLVDKDDKLVSTNTATNYTVSECNASTKTTTSHTEANMFLKQ